MKDLFCSVYVKHFESLYLVEELLNSQAILKSRFQNLSCIPPSVAVHQTMAPQMLAHKWHAYTTAFKRALLASLVGLES